MSWPNLKTLTRSISGRLAASFVLTLGACLAAVFVFTYFWVDHSLEQSDHEVVLSKWQEMNTAYKTGGSKGLRDFLSQSEMQTRDLAFMVRLFESDGSTLFLKNSRQKKNFDFTDLSKKSQKSGWGNLPAIDDEDRFDFYTAAIGPDLFLQVGKSSEGRGAVLENLLAVFILTSLAFAALGTLLGLWSARRELRPLESLSKTMLSIEAGDFSKRVPLISVRNELRELGETFNRMSGRTEKLMTALRETMDDVAHDLRTPLTRARVLAETAIVSGRPEETLSALQDCAENMSEVSNLIDQLLDISEADAGATRIHRIPAHVPSLLADIVDLYQPVADEKRVLLEIQCLSDLTVPLDARMIKRALANLVDNAIKFSPEGPSRVLVQAQVHPPDAVTFLVRDEGLGIPEADLPLIWNRFFRGSKSRTTAGSGLGLSLVRSIITAHHGTITVQSQPGDTRFQITLPRT